MTNATPPAAGDHAPFLERAFDTPPEEATYDVRGVRGEIPRRLRGSYYLNGPARFVRGAGRYRHWLDGDGMVACLRFEDGAARFTARWVRSAKWVEEEGAGRFLYRAFGTAFPDDRLRRGVGLETPVNVSVVHHGGKLLAFGEQGLPWELDSETLETRGEHTFDRRLTAVSPLSAHPHVDPEDGEMLNFGVSYSGTPTLTLYRFDPDGRLVLRHRHALEIASSMHDFAISRHFAVFYQSPFLLDLAAVTARGQTLQDALIWRPELGSRLLVMRRSDGELVATVPIGNAYCLHLGGAFEEGGRLVIDALELNEPIYDQYAVPDLFPAVRRSRPRRYVVDVAAAALVQTRQLPYREMADFPAVDPRRWSRSYDDFWVLGISATEKPGRKFFDRLVHLHWPSRRIESWTAPPHGYLGGEPVFLPDPADDRRGWVLCQRFDAEHRAMTFLLFDAHDVERGPVAELPLENPIHLGFHACWVAAP